MAMAPPFKGILNRQEQTCLLARTCSRAVRKYIKYLDSRDIFTVVSKDINKRICISLFQQKAIFRFAITGPNKTGTFGSGKGLEGFETCSLIDCKSKDSCPNLCDIYIAYQP